MQASAFLIFNTRGIVRMAKGKRARSWEPRQRPALGAGEYAVLVTVNVPDAVFKAAPTPEATITVPESAVLAPVVRVDVETFEDTE